MREVEKKIAKVIVILSNNGHFTPLPSRDTARFITRYKKPSRIFFPSLVREKNALLHFHAFRGKRERELTSISMGKQIHLSSPRDRPRPVVRRQDMNTNICDAI